jgi:hypothetical protein
MKPLLRRAACEAVRMANGWITVWNLASRRGLKSEFVFDTTRNGIRSYPEASFGAADPHFAFRGRIL